MQDKFDHITAVIVTYNEEDNIERTLNAVRKLKDVIVLDSGSSDQTVALAASFHNVRVITRPFDNHSNQWNFGLSCASASWILSLDADYVVPEEVLEEISGLPLDQDAYFASFTYCISGKPIRGAVLPPRPVFFNKSKCYYLQDGHTQKLFISGSAGKLNGKIIHDDRKSLERWLHSQNAYANLEVDKLLQPNSELEFVDHLRLKTVFTPALVFFYSLIYRGGFRDGRRGLWYALQRAYAEILLLLKRMEKQMK